MRPFHDIPIKHKLTLLIMLCSTAAMLLGGVCSISYEWVRFRREIVNDLTTQAEIIGANSAAALAFRDARAADEILSALRARREIVSARLYGTDGSVFAEYRQGETHEDTKTAPPQGEGHRFEQGHLIIVSPDQAGCGRGRQHLAAGQSA